MKQHRRSGWARLAVEQLEDRLTPSGNVTAAVVNGTLIVKGDGGNNGITITSAGGMDTVTGTNFTSVNGVGSASFPAASIANISVTMQNGNDQVQVQVDVPNALTITAGSGNDFLTFGNPTFGGPNFTANSVTIKANSSGNTLDNVQLTNVTVGAASLTTGGGNDFMFISGQGSTNLFGSLTINTGGGNPNSGFFGGDQVNVQNTNVTGPAGITTGSGNDFVSVFGSSFGSLSIITGGAKKDVGFGGDQVRVNQTTVFGSATIITGGGNDALTLGGPNATDFFSVGGALNVKTGDGFDTVEAGNTTAGSGTVDGQGGTDVYQDDGGNFGYSVVNFEGFIF